MEAEGSGWEVEWQWEVKRMGREMGMEMKTTTMVATGQYAGW